MSIKVVELFAGVGGFRLGLEGWNGKSASSNYTKDLKSNYEVVWSNQWEPSTSIQHANLVYKDKWQGANHCGDDIDTIASNEVSDTKVDSNIPDHDLLVGGFPCQDYSVAGVNTNGIEGKKGVLWWNIHRILEVKRPKFILLENVDRLLKSPVNKRGRDFAILLATLSDLGYDVEWKVINAADYGMPQRRRRVFIFGAHKASGLTIEEGVDWISQNSVLGKSFPSQIKGDRKAFELKGSAVEISNDFVHGKFYNCGSMVGRNILTFDYTPKPDNNINYSDFGSLKDVLIDHGKVGDEFFVDSKKVLKTPIIKEQKPSISLSYLQMNSRDEAVLLTELDKWKYLKGRKAEKRVSSKGAFYYTEGPLSLSDDINLPSRTIITSEGGSGASRFKHLVELEKDVLYRRLTPLELERLNMFPDNHTKHERVTDAKRAFFMGNALVVGIVERIGVVLSKCIKESQDKSALQHLSESEN
ncbi:DNA (cytosine-5-)-methyltransferase [Seonamhaeicola sp. ML3]|uniref:DNA (cytosine-5-)-methyltransferase n=1 Tax=Seonamhaeicola sp. ML3 TaxID=2937786 RepID=UPI00200D1FB2|nr:DNA (cytosine-5-)-methyltransferase [Seonamhaeicola sp. ML3]